MGWFERFATEGLILPALLAAFGSLVILRAPGTPLITTAQLSLVPAWLRWFAVRNSERLQRRCGWAMVGCAVVIAAVRVA